MRKILLMGFLLVGLLGQSAQAVIRPDTPTRAVLNPDDTSFWKINKLKAPSSPGASLLGISPNAIQRPVDPSAFMVSFLNATNNLTTIPNSYAVDFVPIWLFFRKNITYDKFKSNDVGNNILQTLDVSFALNNQKDTTTQKTNTQIAVGLKVSILRGTLQNLTLKQLDTAQNLLLQYSKLKKKYRDSVINQPGYPQLSGAEQLSALLNAEKKALKEAKQIVAGYKAIAQRLDFTRTGVMLDLAGGLAYNFVNQANGSLYNSGVWLTGGYQATCGFAALGIVRFLYNPSVIGTAGSIIAQPGYHTLDYGTRLLYDSSGDKFTFGGEFVYRDISNNPDLKSSWRYALSTDYQIGKNQILSFNIGRDFDGTINKGGSLLATLNFIMGFGNTRPAN